MKRGGARPGAGRKPKPQAPSALLRVRVKPAVVDALRFLQAEAGLPTLGDALAEWHNLVALRDEELAAGIEERRAAKLERDGLIQALRDAVRRADKAEASIAARAARRAARAPRTRPDPQPVPAGVLPLICACGAPVDVWGQDSGLCQACRVRRVAELEAQAEPSEA